MSWILVAAVFFNSLMYSEAPVIHDPTEVNAELGKDVVLPCWFPRDSKIKVLEWSRPDFKSNEYVFFFRNGHAYENYQHKSFKGQVELTDPSMKNGNVSVTLKNVSVSDAGTYNCRVLFNENMTLKCLIKLNVTSSVVKDEESRKKKHENTSQWVTSIVLVFVFVVVIFLVIAICKRNPKYKSILPV